MKKKVLISVVILALLVGGLFFVIDRVSPETYSTARQSSEKFLRRNEDELESIALGLLREGKEASGAYRDHYYSYYPGNEQVVFEIGSQGMLGGQYWSLVYTKDGLYCGESESYRFEEAGGNNIVAAERLEGCWWFVWTDYDGTDRSDR